MAITRASLTSGQNNSGGATSFATASITPTADRLVVVALNLSDGVQPVLSSVSGNGLTWSVIDSLYWKTTTIESDASRQKLILIAAASGSSPSAGAVTFDFGAQAMNRGAWSVYELNGTGVASGVAGCFIQVVKSTADTSGSSRSLTLAAAGAADNRPFYAQAHRENEAITPRANWTEIHEEIVGTVLGAEMTLETQERLDAFETTASASWTTSCRNGAMAFEIKAAVATTISFEVGHIPF